MSDYFMGNNRARSQSAEELHRNSANKSHQRCEGKRFVCFGAKYIGLILTAMLFHFFLILPLAKAQDLMPADPAQLSSPEQVSIATPIYRPSFADFTPSFGEYTYTVSWSGIPAATLTFSCEPDGMYYHLVAAARTWSGVDLFYRLRYKAEGVVSALDYLPVRTVIEQKENSRVKHTEIEFKGDGQVHSYRQTTGEDPKELLFAPNNFMLDPFSAAYLARSQHWELGDTKDFDTFNGKSRYLISLTATEKISMLVDDKPRDVWVIVPKVINLVNAQQTKKLREAKIYVTADERRDIIQIVSSVFIGSVTTRLESFKPYRHAAAGMTMAKRDSDTFFN